MQLLYQSRYAILGTDGRYGYAKENLQYEELKPLPADLPFNLYSSLMGLLASSGATLVPGPNWYWYPRTIVLKLSSTNLIYLRWLMETFSPRFDFHNTSKVNKASGSHRFMSAASELAITIWAHWNETERLDAGLKLPLHFEEYFSWYTLAFWAMRSGQYSGNYFYIQVSMLSDADKAVLMSVLQAKCGLESRLTMNNTKLAISNPELVVSKLNPLVHSSQMYRLEK